MNANRQVTLDEKQLNEKLSGIFQCLIESREAAQRGSQQLQELKTWITEQRLKSLEAKEAAEKGTK